MPRDFSRSASPVSYPIKDRNYRDRSDARPKRKDRDGSDDAAPARKKIQMPRKETNYPSVNELKKRIRDVKRLLNKVDLPADARIVQERALAGYEKDLEDENNRRDRSKMIKKYHFVRFLDRKTATKDVNRLLRREKALSSSESSKKTNLAHKIHVARVNLNYTIYYPLTEKYIALYAKVKKDKASSKDDDAKDSEDDDTGFRAIHTTVEDKPALWHTVEKCMKDGTLDLLRDGKLSSREEHKSSSSTRQSEKKNAKSKKTEPKKDNNTKPSKTSSRVAAKKNERTPPEKKAAINQNNDDDDESDGGFFEM